MRDLIVSEVGRIEHGMRVLTDDLVLGQDAEVDAFACDASGAPVLLFAAAPEQSSSVPSRVLRAHAWLRSNAAWLAEELGDPGLRPDLPIRTFVLGLEVRADTVAELGRLGIEGLTILQFCTFSLSGRQRLGLTEVLGASKSEAGKASRRAPLDPFRVPAGILDPACRSTAAHFLDLLRRVDPRMTATGDRFSRRLYLGGCLLAELGLVEGQLLVRLPGAAGPVDQRPGEDPREDPRGDEVLELTDESCLLAVDLVIRMVLFLELGHPAADDVPGHPSTEDVRHRDAPAAAPPAHALAAVPPSAVSPSAVPPSAVPPSTVSPSAVPPAETLLVSAVRLDPIFPAPRPEPLSAPAADPSSPFQLDPRPGLEEDRFSLEPIRRSVAQAQLSREEFSALGED